VVAGLLSIPPVSKKLLLEEVLAIASVRSDKGWLFLDFRFQGFRCREFLNLRDNRDAKIEANRIKRGVEAEVRAGTLDYARRFPNSRHLDHFGVRPQRNPTLVEFAREWVEEQPDLAKTTDYWYRCLLSAYVFRHPIGQKLLNEISDRDLNLLIKDLREHPARSGRPLSARSINALLARIRTVMSVAQRRKLISANPMAYVENLKETRPEVDPFDLDEAWVGSALTWQCCSSLD
jgi:integrase